ncbi:MAG: tetratricopeptide repeat protein, partial [Thermodesulfobacteriota bacterium]
DYSAFPISRTLNLTSTSLVITTLIVGVILYRFYKPAAFGIFWFFITLLPASNIVPLKIPIAERFLYIPSWGFVFLSGIFLSSIWMTVHTRVFKGILLCLVLSIVIFYTITTIERNRIWRNDLTFWSDVVKRCPSSRSFTNLGIELFGRGRLDDAITQLRNAIANSKDAPSPHYHLGDAYTEKGWYAIASREYLIALEITEKEASTGKVNTKLTQNSKGYIMNSMGLLYMKQGLLNEATASFNEAIRFRPEMMEAYYNLGLAYQRSGLPDDAMVAYYEALRIKPDYYDARKKLAKIYVKKGLMEEASKVLGQ